MFEWGLAECQCRQGMQCLFFRAEYQAEACLLAGNKHNPYAFAVVLGVCLLLSLLSLSLSPLLSFLPFPFCSLCIIFQLSPLLSTLLCFPFHPLPLITEHSFPCHSCFRSLLLFSVLFSLSVLAWGPGLLSTVPSGSFPLSLTVSHMSIRKGCFPLFTLPFLGLL